VAFTVSPVPMKIAVADLDLGEQAIDRRVTAGDAEIAGLLLRQFDIDHDAVGRRAGLVGDLDGLEVVQILQPPLGAIDQPLVVGIALGDIEFAPDHVTAGAGVAMDVDALDVSARALFDRERHIDA
jgi:hypothetical protein